MLYSAELVTNGYQVTVFNAALLSLMCGFEYVLLYYNSYSMKLYDIQPFFYKYRNTAAQMARTAGLRNMMILSKIVLAVLVHQEYKTY